MTNARRLFICSCIVLVTSAFSFSIHQDIMQDLGTTFNFSQTQNGGIAMAFFWGMATMMLIGGFICDFLGIKGVLFLALASHFIGSLGIVFCINILGLDPKDAANKDTYFWWLWAAAFILGGGNGWTEVGINPLVATLYPREKTHYLNILHAWWPGGLIIGGVLAVIVRQVIFHDRTVVANLKIWQFSMILVVVPAIVYGIMLVGSYFPPTERVQSGVSTVEMLKEGIRPMFLFWAFCMLLTAATELGPQKWQNSVMTSTLGIASAGTYVLIYTSVMMFVLRHFAGPIAHKISPVGMLTASAFFACVGLYLLSYAHNVATAFGFATIYGLGIAYFWPTMLGQAAERFPKGGALILCLMGTAGNISVGGAQDVMGRIADHYTVAYVQQNNSDLSQTLLQMKNGQPTALNEDEVKQINARIADAKKAGQSPSAADVQASEAANAAQQQGFKMAFRWVSLLPLCLIFIFGAVAISDKMRGGYKAVHIEEVMRKEPQAIPGTEEEATPL